MFLIYEGFKNDASDIFKPLIEKFHFSLTNVSDYRVILINNKCKLDFYNEVSLIIWYYNPEKYNKGILLTQYFYEKDKIQYDKLNELYFKKSNKEYFINLCDFLIKNFSEELKEN